MRIAIIGTRGIPNHYGGFEQCAEYLAVGLVKKGYEVVVYNSHNHPHQEKTWNSVEICHCYDPEYNLGVTGRFLYDYNCIKDLRKKKFDVILQLGYTSSSVWGWLLPRNTVVTTNMGGLERTGSQYSKLVRTFLRFAEKLAVRYSDYLIADSVEMQKYLANKYNKESTYISYGAEIFDQPNPAVLDEFRLEINQYDMLIARMGPENSIETILDGVVKADTGRKFLVIGDAQNDYGTYLRAKFNQYKNIKFCEGIYNIDKLNNLRYYANLYFHGHTVDGISPSLLEAMASNSLICSNDNEFNRALLKDDALYFLIPDDVAGHLTSVNKSEVYYEHFMANNKQKIIDFYTCDTVINAYANHFESIISKSVKIYQPKELGTDVSLLLENL